MSKHGKVKKGIVALIVIVCVAAVLAAAGMVWMFLIRNPLVGTWVYDEYTQYVFEKNGSGRLDVDDVRYEYTLRCKVI